MAIIRTVRTADGGCFKQEGYYGNDNQGNYGFIATSPGYPCDRNPWGRSAGLNIPDYGGEGTKGYGQGDDKPILSGYLGRSQEQRMSNPHATNEKMISDLPTIVADVGRNPDTYEALTGEVLDEVETSDSGCGCEKSDGSWLSCECNQRKLLIGAIALAVVLGALAVRKYLKRKK